MSYGGQYIMLESIMRKSIMRKSIFCKHIISIIKNVNKQYK